MVPISLYVTIELVKIGQVIFINLDKGMLLFHVCTCECMTPSQTFTMRPQTHR
jgi:hypothetical protein